MTRYDSEHSGGAEGASGEKNKLLKPDDHDFGGLHESGDGLAFFQAHFANGIGGDDGSNALTADGEGHLRYQAVNFYVGDAADELVAPADAPEIAPALAHFAGLGGTIEELVDLPFGDAMVAAGRFGRTPSTARSTRGRCTPRCNPSC